MKVTTKEIDQCPWRKLNELELDRIYEKTLSEDPYREIDATGEIRPLTIYAIRANSSYVIIIGSNGKTSVVDLRTEHYFCQNEKFVLSRKAIVLANDVLA